MAWFKKFALCLIVLTVLALLFVYAYVVFPLWGVPFNAQRHGQLPLVPAWALECWTWECDDISEAALLEHLNGYVDHDFPIRTLLIDCPWATRYNDFTVDKARFPNVPYCGMPRANTRVVARQRMSTRRPLRLLPGAEAVFGSIQRTVMIRTHIE